MTASSWIWILLFTRQTNRIYPAYGCCARHIPSVVTTGEKTPCFPCWPVTEIRLLYAMHGLSRNLDRESTQKKSSTFLQFLIRLGQKIDAATVWVPRRVSFRPLANFIIYGRFPHSLRLQLPVTPQNPNIWSRTTVFTPSLLHLRISSAFSSNSPLSLLRLE